MQPLASPPVAAWLHLGSVFVLSLTALLALEWLWRALWARGVLCAPRLHSCWSGKRDAARRALILGCVFVISAALTFAR